MAAKPPKASLERLRRWVDEDAPGPAHSSSLLVAPLVGEGERLRRRRRVVLEPPLRGRPRGLGTCGSHYLLPRLHRAHGVSPSHFLCCKWQRSQLMIGGEPSVEVCVCV